MFSKVINLITVCSLLYLSSPALADELITIGEPFPSHTMELLQSNAKLSHSDLKGKLTLLDFWSTSCGSCVAAIPHINELSEQVKDLPVQIVSVTSDSQDRLNDFLKERPLNTIIGLDRGDKLKTNLGLATIPTAVLIDKNGKIAALLDPRHITAEELKQMAQGKATPASVVNNCIDTITRQFKARREISLNKPIKNSENLLY